MPVFQFDDVKVDTQTFRIYKAGRLAQVEPKAFEVLVYLIENRGRLIEKRELLDSIWKETFVTENALTREIAVLRRALDEDHKSAKYIETVPTKGYRFIAELRSSHAPPSSIDHEEVSPPSGGRRSEKLLLAGVASVFLIIVALLAYFLTHYRRGIDHEAKVSNNLQITTHTGLSVFPSFSADGNAMAYSSNRSGVFEIYVRQLTPGSGELQLTNDGQQNVEPAWSPDGKWIAYTNRGKGGIWIVPALGGAARQLVEFGSRPAWSPDGTTLAFQSANTSGVDVDSLDAFPPSVIWLLSVVTGNRWQLTRAGAPNGGHGAPSWAPDSKHIVFSNSDYRFAEIWTVAADGTHPSRLARKPLSAFNSPVFAPDGRSVFMGGISGASNYGLWQVEFSASGPGSGNPIQVSNSGPSRIKHLSLSRDGRHLLYTSLSPNSNLWVAPVTASGAAQGEPHALTSESGCRNTLPMFSPDANWIAYMSCRAGFNGAVWLMRNDGTQARQLTSHAADEGLPTWFPDGETIAFSSDRGGELQIRSLSIATGREQLLYRPERPLGFFRLSPDGTRLAFSAAVEGKLRVFVVDLKNNNVRQVTPDSESMGFPCWSPDGKFLVTDVQRNTGQVAIVPSTGGGFIQLTPDEGQSWACGWSPDLDHIAFAGQRAGIWNLYAISRRTKAVTQITHYSQLNEFVRYPAWSPKGDQIAYEYAETTGNIWMLDFK